MAQSNFSGSWGSNLTLDASYVVKSQNIANNTSVITFTVKLIANGYASITDSGTKPLTINVNGGGAIPQVNVSISPGQTKVLLSNDYTIGHNSDGTKTADLSAKLDINIGGYGSATVALKAYLPKINRTSTITVPTATLGSAVNIAISKADTNYTSTLRYEWYGSTGTIVDKTTSTSYSWTPPLSLASGIPNSVGGSGKLYIDTYSGTTLLGTSSATLTANVPSSVVPTLSSVTLSDTNSKVSAILTSPNFLQVLSNIAVNFTGASGAYGSTIQSYKAEIVGKNQSTNSNGGTLGIMNYNGTYTVRATVTDSRGRTSAPFDKTITVLEYFLPVFYFEATRIGSDSQTIQVKRNAKIAPISVGGTQKNTMTITFRTSLAGKNTWTTSQTGGGSWTAINTLTDSLDSLSGVFSVSSSYDIEGTISDRFSGDIKFSATIGTKVVVSSKDKDGRHGFGQIADKSLPAGSVQSTGGFYFKGKSVQHYQQVDDTGKITRLDSVDLNTIINDTKPIAVYATANMPIAGQNYYYLEVFQHAAGNAYVLQRATLRLTNLRVFERVRENGIWGSWVELMTVNSPQMINTGWISTGVSGVYYKQTGDIVTVKISVTTTANKNLDIGSVPASLVPANGLMLRVASWTTDQTFGRNLQVGTSGGMTLISTSRGDEIRTQVSWTI